MTTAQASPVASPQAPLYDMWDEDATPFRRHLCLRADSYRPEPLFPLPPCPGGDDGAYAVSPGGDYGYQNRILPRGRALHVYGPQLGGPQLGGPQLGMVEWDGDVVIPMLIDLTRRSRPAEYYSPTTPVAERIRTGLIWMSLTPSEMLSQRTAVRMARGTVVIGGLGLGWLVKKVATKPEVDRVIVVEQSQEQLDWYGYALCGRHSKVTDVICDNVYHQLGKHGLAARYLLDIWPDYSGAARDERLVPFRRQLRRRLWAWGID